MCPGRNKGIAGLQKRTWLRVLSDDEGSCWLGLPDNYFLNWGVRALGRVQRMRAKSKSPRAFRRGIHSPTVTQDSSGLVFVTWKFPMIATSSGIFTPSPTRGKTTLSELLIKQSFSGSTCEIQSGLRQRRTLTFEGSLACKPGTAPPNAQASAAASWTFPREFHRHRPKRFCFGS